MYKNLERAIKYQFGTIQYLEEAVTHSSYVNESVAVQHNERLEFLGDAVLELCVSQRLYSDFADAREGELTSLRAKLVSQPSLAAVAKELEFEKYLRLGKGEENQGGRVRDSLLSDTFEAMLGAVFMDGGFAAACTVVNTVFAKHWPECKPALRNKDYKSLLQELIQKRFHARPIYILTGSTGPEHSKTFEVKLTLPDEKIFQATANSVKRAEQQAASMALEHYAEKD